MLSEVFVREGLEMLSWRFRLDGVVGRRLVRRVFGLRESEVLEGRLVCGFHVKGLRLERWHR